MRPTQLAAIVSVLSVSGCVRIIELDDDEDQVDAIVVTGDASPLPDGAWNLDCGVPLPCPPPSASNVTVCGWIHDTETDGVVAAESPTREPCTSATSAGPCSLRVRYFDALDFASNPASAVPLVPQTRMVDDCGRYRATDMSRPAFGFLAVVVDDDPSITPTEPHRITTVNVANGLVSPGILRAYSTRASTDLAWSTSAALNGATFAQRGVLLKVFTYRGQPVAGVGVRRDAASIPNDDFYFSDSGVTRRTVDPVRTTTGANGSVLVINSTAPIAHDGAGSEPSGCQWPSSLGASVPGAVAVERVEVETPGGAACP